MRRRLDQYFSPRWATKVLTRHHNIAGSIFEPCSGLNDIADELRQHGRVLTNDIDPAMPADCHLDAADPNLWVGSCYDWVISNPPFNVCQPIIEHAFVHSKIGMAMLLRLSYLEPCNNRAAFLILNPPDQVIVLPRISFTGNGKTDSVTCAWFVWIHSGPKPSRPILVVSKDEVKACAVQAQTV